MAKTALMKVWNVELGLAVHIKAPNGKYLVIDLGSTSTVSPLRSLVGKNVGHMIITHPHHDHFSDIKNIQYAKPTVLWRVKDYTREDLLQGVREQERDDFEKYCAFCSTYTAGISPENEPSDGTSFDGMKVQVFNTNACDKGNKNNLSAVVVVEMAMAKVVICGDNQKASFNELMKNPDFVKAIENAWVLVAPHHGRESGYHEDFVNRVKPYLTIISDTTKSGTSVTDKYAANTRGAKIREWGSFNLQDRKCLTTRNDGNIQVEFGECDSNPNGMLVVYTKVN
jgi:competence protein ComEC